MIYGYSIGADGNPSAPIKLNNDDYPHMLITGGTGSGKSYALQFLLGSILHSQKDAEIFICDFKNSADFHYLDGYPFYYTGDSCYEGIMEYYARFDKSRKEGITTRKRVLIIDEYPGLLMYLGFKDKDEKTKKANEVSIAIASILSLARELRHGIWVITQRADASLFSNGARDNFTVVIGLGRLSKEQKGMIFFGEEIPNEPLRRGEGYLLADGLGIKKVKYPQIADIADWKWHIYDILMRSLEQNNDLSQSTPLA